MRLLNVHTLVFQSFHPSKIPKYAIASHKWFEDSEATIKDVQRRRNTECSGYKKVQGFADYVKEKVDDIDWIWIDTCCINQKDAAELSEAVNLMFEWYRNAELCLAYLADVESAEDKSSFANSQWFKRGWTLQELLAPLTVIFLTRTWEIIRNKGGSSHRCSRTPMGLSLERDIATITGIPEQILRDYETSLGLSENEKLQWMEGRSTTREEDMSYALYGIFGVTPGANYGEKHSGARRRLLAAINPQKYQSAQQPEETTQRTQNLPFDENQHFVGRRSELDAMKQKFFRQPCCRRLAVVGLGGIGKTQVALSFAYSVWKQHRGFSVFWVPAVSVQTFEKAFEEIAEMLGLIIHPDDRKSARKLVCRRLSSPAAGSWLLVIDNADDANILNGRSETDGLLSHLPRSDQGLMLFTTRNHKIAQSLAGVDVVIVGRLSNEDAMTMLTQAVVEKESVEGQTATSELLVELDNLPLAITQAAAYINVNRISAFDYLGTIRSTERDMVEVLSMEIGDKTYYRQAEHAVATTWIISFEQILEQDPDAAELLRYISCIECKAIPESILPRLESKARITSAVGMLCSYSFLARRQPEKTYDMHRLVHLSTRIWDERYGSPAETRRKAILHLSEVFPFGDYEKRETWRAYLPHAARMRNNVADQDEDGQGKLYKHVGYCLQMDGKSREAVSWLEESCRCYEDVAEDDPERLSSQHVLAGAYQANGQIKEAIKMLEHVVIIEKEVLAEDHPYRLPSQHELARAYKANGQIKEAIKMLEHVVIIEKEVLAEDHPDRLTSQHELARAYKANGHMKEAIELLCDVVMKQSKLRQDHPSRLASEQMLTMWCQEDRQLAEAVESPKHFSPAEMGFSMPNARVGLQLRLSPAILSKCSESPAVERRLGEGVE